MNFKKQIKQKSVGAKPQLKAYIKMGSTITMQNKNTKTNGNS